MFIFFHQHKLRHKKGQLVPIFIVVLTVLLIMAMITVNLAKISSIKTDSSNAADAGALAGGSVMAGLFNAQAVANSQLIAEYQMFVAEMGLLVAMVILGASLGASACSVNDCGDIACCPASGCRIGAKVALIGIKAAIVSFAAFHAAQFFTYMNMRKQAEKGREQAIGLAYRYAFINSGIGNKLISGSPPQEPADKRGDDNNYSEVYNEFIKSEDVTRGNYTWIDGQGRQHKVNINVAADEVDNYKLQYTALPTVVVEMFLLDALAAAVAELASCSSCPCSMGQISLSVAGIQMDMLWVLGGLVPGIESDASALTNILFPVCWVVDINHNHRLNVTTWQEHGKQDYGLWEAVYPRLESRSVVNFNGSGKIYRPNARFDTDIIETD